MTTINVQFADATKQTIVSYFSSAQDSGAWPNCGAVDSSDPTWKAYYDSRDLFTQQFLVAPTANGGG